MEVVCNLFKRRTAALFRMVLRRAGLSATAGHSCYSFLEKVLTIVLEHFYRAMLCRALQLLRQIVLSVRLSITLRYRDRVA